MAIERTLIIVKPDAVERNLVGAILGHFEAKGLTILAARMVRLSRRDAEGFYAVHQGKSFFNDLVEYMTSNPCLPCVLEGENAVARVREILGATDFEKAEEGTIRRLYAQSLSRNSCHGSDSVENAKVEIAHFFSATEIHPRG